MKVINELQKSILTYLEKVSESEHFYLAGGTALAEFYLRHRQSNDLDFFTPEEALIMPFSRQLEKLLRAESMVIDRQRSFQSFVELLVKSGKQSTIIHLAQDSSFRFEELKEFADYPGLKVDSLTDIASNKLLALFSRATLRDFIDIYVIVKKDLFTTEELVKKAKIKDPGFDLYWLAVAFERMKTFKKDAADMLLLIEPVNFEDLNSFFDSWRKTIVQDF
ncbi:MAG: nucleotidyl transferase AbiEii/AbiGii toxin family protein [Candidatus Omnitrophota bacterium]